MIVGHSKSMQAVKDQIEKIAPTSITVCLMGESGTGKELAARWIHDLSLRKSKPFVAINCGALPENLVESLFFGHEKGSFTGATEKHCGVFEQAHEGTLFLDEIGEMPLDLQTRLLRVLETHTIRRVGGKVDIPVNVRLITATLRDLKSDVANDFFRHDLFYRLFIFPIYLPPLREHLEDLEILMQHFLQTMTDEEVEITPEAIAKLKAHYWPGNVRELKNVIQRALLTKWSHQMTPQDIEYVCMETKSSHFGVQTLTDQEKIVILETLRKAQGNHSKAARLLGIARTTLASKLKRHGLTKEEWMNGARRV